MKKSLYIRIRNKAAGLLVILMPFFFYATALAGISSHKNNYVPFSLQDTTVNSSKSVISNYKQIIKHPAASTNSIVNSSNYSISDLLNRNPNPEYISVKAPAATPTISCPGNIVSNTDPGVCKALVSGLAATINDSDGDITTLTWSLSGATLGSSPITGINYLTSFTFNKGVTTVTYRVTDALGAYAICIFTVTVNDLEIPTVECPPSEIIPIPSCATSTDPITFSLLGVQDNCGVNIFSGISNDAPPQFPVGVTTVIWTVKDVSGNQATCSHIVTVINEPTMILTMSTTPVSCFGGNDGTVSVAVLGGTPPYTYLWNTAPAQNTSTASNLFPGTYTVTVTDKIGCTASAQATVSQPTTALSLSLATQANVNCFGESTGSATVAANGGTAPYTYSWNTVPVQTSATAINLSAGNYTATATDAEGCTKTIDINITETTPIVVSTSKTDVLCFGEATGTATVFASGGTPPYTYTWLTVPIQTTATASNLPAGTYTVAVYDAELCYKPAFVTINQPALDLTASFTQVNVVCAGDPSGSITVTGSGGVAPYQYNINGGVFQASGTFNNLPDGTYTIVVLDANSCTENVPVTITAPATALDATITNPTNVSCTAKPDGSATVTASGGTAPYTYLWNTVPAQTTASATGLVAGAYTVTVTDAVGCTKVANVTITEPAPLVVTTSKTDVPCFGEATGTATALVSGGTLPYTYSWLTVPVQTTATASNLAAGTYTFAVIDAAGCFKPAFVEIKQPDSKLTASFTQVDVVCAGNTGSITVTGSGGVAPYQYNMNGGAFQASGIFNSLSAGVYNIITRDANNCTFNVTATITEPANAMHVSISQTNVLCVGQANGTAIVTAVRGTTPYSYLWYTTPVQTNDTIQNLPAGNYIVTTTDAAGCTVTDTAFITEPALALSGSITNQVNYDCATGTLGSVTVAGAGGTPNYQYSLDGGPFLAIGTFTNLAVGNHAVVVRDANNCETSVPVNILPSVGADAGLSQVLCNSNTASLVGNSPGTGTGSWAYVSGPNVPVISPSTGNVASATGLIASTTPYIFSYSINSGSCSTTDTMSVLNHPPTTPSFAGNDQHFCNSTGNLTSTLSGNTPVIGTGLWSQLAGPTAATIQDVNNPNTDVSGLSTGNYTFQWLITNGACLPSSDAMNIEVHTTLVADAGTGQIIPAGTTATLTGSVSGGSGFYAYSWQPSNLLENASIQNPVTVILNSTTTFTLTVLDLNTRCTDDATVEIVIDNNSNNFVAVADYDTTLVDAAETIDVLGNDLNPDNEVLAVSFCGFPSHGIVILNSDNTITYTPYIGYEGDDEFCYQICNSLYPQVCSDTKVYIHVKLPGLEDLLPYSGVSPNSDGLNDVWKIKGIEKYPDNTVIIFNRWGDKLLEFANYNNTTHSWNGKNENGNPLPDGTYYYILDVKNVGVLKGWIYIRGK